MSYDIYIADVDSNTAPRLAVGGQQDTWYPLDWSPDDTKLLLWKYVSINESYLFVADVNSGTVKPIEGEPRERTGKSKPRATQPQGRRQGQHQGRAVRPGWPRRLHRYG